MMITIFNRKELLVTWDSAVVNSAEQILKEYNIAYILRMEDTPGGVTRLVPEEYGDCL